MNDVGNENLPTGDSGQHAIEKVRQGLQEKGEATRNAASNAIERANEASAQAVERAKEIRESERVGQVRRAIQEAPQAAQDLTLRSRTSRLAAEEKNKSANPIQRMFRSGIGRFVLKPIVEAIPSPAGYGPGDVVTGVSALSGRDILTGQHLDGVDRVLYGIATAIPFVPSIVLVEPARFVRHRVEDAVYSHSQGKSTEAARHARQAGSTAKDIGRTIQQGLKPPPPKT